MRKFLLALTASLFIVDGAAAAPYRVVDGNGVAIGPLVGSGLVILKAPDGTPVTVGVQIFGFDAGRLIDLHDGTIFYTTLIDCLAQTTNNLAMRVYALPVQGEASAVPLNTGNVTI